MPLTESDIDTLIDVLCTYIADYGYFEKYPYLIEYQNLQDAKAVLKKLTAIYESMSEGHKGAMERLEKFLAEEEQEKKELDERGDA